MSPRGRARGADWDPMVPYMQFMWAVLLLSLQYFLAAKVADPFGRLMTVLLVPLLGIFALRLPMLLASSTPLYLHPALLVLLTSGIVNLPFVKNLTSAKNALQPLVIIYIFTVATLAFIRRAKDVVPLVALFGYQFLWWAINSGTLGMVLWHPSRANQNDYAAIMVSGVGLCYWIGQAASRQWERALLVGLSLFCVAGVLFSYARGATLTIPLIAALILYRSRHRLRLARNMVLSLGVAFLAATVVLPSGLLESELMSVFEEGTEEGGTGGRRWNHWKAAFRVWTEEPILGTGAGNFGIYASSYFQYGEVKVFENPATLHDENLHNLYVQVTSEFGIVGLFGLLWLIRDFHRKNAALRDPRREALWHQQAGPRFRLAFIANGLEAANLANLVTGMFYSSFLYPDLWLIWGMNLLLWSVTRLPKDAGPAPRISTARGVRRVPGAAGPHPARSPS